MKVLKRLLSLVLTIALTAAVLSSCKATPKKNKYTSYSLDYFDTVTTVIGYEESEESFNEAVDAVMSTLDKYHKLFDIYNSYSGINNLKTVNDLTDGEHSEVVVDSSIIDLIELSLEMYEKTGGKFNIAMGSVLSIWHKYREAAMMSPEDARVPSEEKLQAAAEHTDISSIVIDKENSTVYITNPETTLDVGAIGKGYAVEMAAQALSELGKTGYILNVGGNVRVVGDKPDGTWVMGIQNPDNESDVPYAEKVTFKDKSLVTSGSYQRFYEVNGVSYHHIIDTDTLFPARYFVSVSVIYPDSAIADALSTSLFCMSYEDGLAVLSAFEGAEAMWIGVDGEHLYSEGFSSYIPEV